MKLTLEQIEATRPEFENLIEEMVRRGDILVPGGCARPNEVEINHMVSRWGNDTYRHYQVQQCWLVWLTQEERLQSVKGE